jgi:hypothetical protein
MKFLPAWIVAAGFQGFGLSAQERLHGAVVALFFLHVLPQQISHDLRHAAVMLCGPDTRPRCDIVAKCDGDVSHVSHMTRI